MMYAPDQPYRTRYICTHITKISFFFLVAVDKGAPDKILLLYIRSMDTYRSDQIRMEIYLDSFFRLTLFVFSPSINTRTDMHGNRSTVVSQVITILRLFFR